MTMFKKIITIPFVVCLSLLIIQGCSEKDDTPVDAPTVAVLTTTPVTSILYTSAVSGGTISSDGGAAITARGICWSLEPDPDLNDPHSSNGTGTGTFTSSMSDLLTDTLYYVKAYATNSQGTAYGNQLTFRTLKYIFIAVRDVDGNIYHPVPIGSQFWLAENLKVTKYRNGDPIANVTTDAQWKTMTTGAYCAYDNLVPNFAAYGNLYNWHALSDSRGICPNGWHVASDSEWTTLGNFLGGNQVAGGKLKSTGTIEDGDGLWYKPNLEADNSSGFTGLPGGYRINYGPFYSLGNVGYFWSLTDTATVNAWSYILDANDAKLKRIFNLKTNGFSVRCCKD